MILDLGFMMEWREDFSFSFLTERVERDWKEDLVLTINMFYLKLTLSVEYKVKEITIMSL